MSNCCITQKQVSKNSGSELCPFCNAKGEKMKIITLKSMLKPTTLDSLNASLTHYFCLSKDCNVVYFDTSKKTYLTSEIKVSVHQKDDSPIVPVYYCFGWTKDKLKENVEKGFASIPIAHIRNNIKENRFGCEVNNPQGSCCLILKYHEE